MYGRMGCMNPKMSHLYTFVYLLDKKLVLYLLRYYIHYTLMMMLNTHAEPIPIYLDERGNKVDHPKERWQPGTKLKVPLRRGDLWVPDPQPMPRELPSILDLIPLGTAVAMGTMAGWEKVKMGKRTLYARRSRPNRLFIREPLNKVQKRKWTGSNVYNFVEYGMR